MANGKNKGNSFERDICTQLSHWWSNGKRDDIFWRAATSGGRATQRSKAGKSTYGQHGDIQAVDPIGFPLTELVTIEIKRGYSKETFADLLDKPAGSPSQWRDFIKQSRRECRESGIPHWLMIAKRDRREICVFMPVRLFNAIRATMEGKEAPTPSVMLNFNIGKNLVQVVGMPLESFFEYVSPLIIRAVANNT